MVKAWVFPKGMTAFQRVSKGFASVAWSLVVLKVMRRVPFSGPIGLVYIDLHIHIW